MNERTAPPGGRQGLGYPTLAELSGVVQRIKGETAATVWCDLTGEAVRLGGTLAADTVIAAMADSDDQLLRVAAHAQMIRVSTCDHLQPDVSKRF